MKHIYRLVVSAFKHRPCNHMPMQLNGLYRDLDTAMAIARKYHQNKQSVTVCEYVDSDLLATWQMEAGSDTVVFDCNETLCSRMDK